MSDKSLNQMISELPPLNEAVAEKVEPEKDVLETMADKVRKGHLKKAPPNPEPTPTGKPSPETTAPVILPERAILLDEKNLQTVLDETKAIREMLIRNRVESEKKLDEEDAIRAKLASAQLEKLDEERQAALDHFENRRLEITKESEDTKQRLERQRDTMVTEIQRQIDAADVRIKYTALTIESIRDHKEG